MIARLDRKQLRMAVWARRLSVYFLLLLILTLLLHRFAALGTPAAINLLIVSFAGLGIALLMAVIALIRIWNADFLGAGQAAFAALLAAIGLAPLAAVLIMAALTPPLMQVETSRSETLVFKDLSVRPPDSLPVVPLDQGQFAAQEEAYPDIKPLTVERSTAEAYALTRAAMHRLGWQLVVEEPPVQDSAGYMQAAAATPILGMTDDVAVEIIGEGGSSTIDFRAASRYLRRDIGTNARLVRSLIAEIKAGIEKGERPVLEKTAPPMPSRAPR